MFINKMKQYYFYKILFFCLFAFNIVQAQVTVSTDLTSTDYKKQKIDDIWSVVNRISPINGVSVTKKMSVNLVRMVGGINKTVNGKLVPDYDYDPCRYDSIANKYIYNWTPLLTRINNVLKTKTKIFQIVLDQPCWAFQHGYKFTSNSKPYNGKDFKEIDRVSIYGNSLPPKDMNAYTLFVKEMMKKLVVTYGKKKVLSWRFRVGSEIETPDHWRGTKKDFISYFANTEKAIRQVLPKAKIGLHTRTPDFVYKKGKEKNYKGEAFASFAKDLITYCYDNNVKYDFWGISDYVIVSDVHPLNLDKKYEVLFKPIVNHPKWYSNTRLDIMEYSSVVSIKGRNFMNASTTHAEIINLEFTNIFLENKDKGLNKIYRWGMKSGSKNKGVILDIEKMIGKTRFTANIAGKPVLKTNKIKALIAKERKNNFDAIVYNYNKENLYYANPEEFKLSVTIKLPVGSKIYYRSAIYSKKQNKFQSFLENKSSHKWLKLDADKRGDPKKILNDKGLKAWRDYQHKNPYAYSSWVAIETLPIKSDKTGSKILLKTAIPSFSYIKFQFREKI